MRKQRHGSQGEYFVSAVYKCITTDQNVWLINKNEISFCESIFFFVAIVLSNKC